MIIAWQLKNLEGIRIEIKY